MNYNFILHLHPKKIRAASLKFNRTFGLGGMAALLFVVQVISGLLLKYHYQPHPAQAYDSILSIQQELFFGQLIRNLHHWAAILLIWVSFLHLLRVVFTGAYHKPRHLSWIFGLGMFLLVIFFNFTGYLLPWDQLAYWAVTIATSLVHYIPLLGNTLQHNLMGGNTINEITLSNFYHLHTGFFPLLLLILMTWHFWHVRKAGGVIQSKADMESPMVPVNPHLIKKEAVVALSLLALLLLLSIFFDAPLKERANPIDSPNPAKAPWYFAGFQELLIHFHPFVAISLIPAILFAFVLWIPFTDRNPDKLGIWFSSSQGKKLALQSAVVSFIATLTLVLASELLPKLQDVLPNWPPVIVSGLLPLALILIVLGLVARQYRKKHKVESIELVQAGFVCLAMCYFTLSVIGIFFRGSNMDLCWPWIS